MRGFLTLSDRIMHSDKLRAIGKGGLYLYLVDHLCYALHHVFPLQNGGTEGHDLCHTFAIAGSFHNLSRYNGDCLWIVEFKATRLSLAGQFRSCKNQEFFLLALGEIHEKAPSSLHRR